MNKLSFIISFLVLTVLLQGCYYDETPNPEGVLPKDISFSKDVQQIFNLNCVSCHAGSLAPNLTTGNSFKELIDGNYIIPFDAENSNLIKSLLGEGKALMPPSGSLSQSDINIVRRWINESSVDN